MSSFDLSVDPREGQYGRLTSAVLMALRKAVGTRLSEGRSQKDIADQIGCDASLLSRVLSGRTKNLTLRTVSDVLWACDHEPEVFSADPIEEITPAYRGLDQLAVIHTWSGQFAPIFRGCASTSGSPRSDFYWTSPDSVVNR